MLKPYLLLLALSLSLIFSSNSYACSALAKCGKEGETCTTKLTRGDGATMITTYRCSACSHGSANQMYLELQKVKSETTIPGTICGAQTAASYTVETTTYKTDPTRQCIFDQSTTEMDSQLEVPPTTVECESCQTSQPNCNPAPAPSASSSPKSSPSPGNGTPCATPVTKCQKSKITLGCLQLNQHITTIVKDGTVYTPGVGRGVPPGGVSAYQGSKTVTQTVADSSQCPNPTRRLGPDICTTSGDAKILGLFCPGDSAPTPTSIPATPKPSQSAQMTATPRLY